MVFEFNMQSADHVILVQLSLFWIMYHYQQGWEILKLLNHTTVDEIILYINNHDNWVHAW